MLICVLVCVTLCSFLFCNNLDEEERTGCFAYTVIWMSCCLVAVNVLWLFLTVPWVGLQCAIVVFPDHTHFLSNSCLLSQRYSLMCGMLTNVHVLILKMSSNFIEKCLNQRETALS